MPVNSRRVTSPHPPHQTDNTTKRQMNSLLEEVNVCALKLKVSDSTKHHGFATRRIRDSFL